MHHINIDNLHCLCSGGNDNSDRIAYVLYPISGMLNNWIEQAAEKYRVSIVVITGMDWQNIFSPWPAKGVPDGSPDFKGESPEFLLKLRTRIIPEIEHFLGINNTPERTVVGVSMSGLFALWQWMECDTFKNIASLSGSFWYEGFMKWMSSRTIPHKDGTAFFLLGEQESKSSVKAFNSVSDNTSAIVRILEREGIKVKFEIVTGDHYSNPIPRLDAAFNALYSPGVIPV